MIKNDNIKKAILASKKQIVPASIYSRIIATYIDIFLLGFISNITLNKIFFKLLEIIFHNDKTNTVILDQTNNSIVENFSKINTSALHNISDTKDLFIALFANYLLNMLLLGWYFCFFWKKFGATPGKMLLGIKIVNQEKFNKKIELNQCIKRFLGYFIAIFSIFWKIFYFKSSRYQFFHDKISQTMVIKN